MSAQPSATRQAWSLMKYRKGDGTPVDSQLGGRVFADVFSGSEPSKADLSAIGFKGGSKVKKSTAPEEQAASPTKTRSGAAPTKTSSGSAPKKASPGKRVRSGLGGQSATSQRTLLGN